MGRTLDKLTEVEADVDELEAKLDSLIALIGSADDEAGDNTVIGQLKQIAANTDPS
jgi:hypothetical protein